MDHDSIRSKLSAYMDGELDESSRDLVSRHLQSCDACGEELKGLDRIDSMVRGMPGISVPETFAFEIVAKVHTANAPRYWKSSLPRRILDRLLLLADSVFELFPGYQLQQTGSLDEFGDFPPLLLSHAYFRLISR